MQHVMIISGGAGASASLLFNTILAQFPQAKLAIEIRDHVRQEAQLIAALDLAQADKALIVHTLIQPDLRALLAAAVAERGLDAIDLAGELLAKLGQRLGRQALGRPGLYRLNHQDEIERAAAVNFTLNHDDGLHPESLDQAEIVILGVSRSGKTPLSMYLGVQGWWVANIPLIDRASLPAELARIERGRLVGLLLTAEAVQAYRRQRQNQLKLPASYSDLATIFEELELARQLYRELGASTLNTSAKPIESCATEVIERVTSRLGSAARHIPPHSSPED